METGASSSPPRTPSRPPSGCQDEKVRLLHLEIESALQRLLSGAEGQQSKTRAPVEAVLHLLRGEMLREVDRGGWEVV